MISYSGLIGLQKMLSLIHIFSIPLCGTGQNESVSACGTFWGLTKKMCIRDRYMEFFASAITTLQTLVVALGAGLGVWGVVNLLEGYGSDNPGSKSQGMKQFMAN